MNIENSFKKLKSSFAVVSGKTDSEVLLKYSGTSLGITSPWTLIIESYQTKGETPEAAINSMFKLIKKELEAKVKYPHRPSVSSVVVGACEC